MHLFRSIAVAVAITMTGLVAAFAAPAANVQFGDASVGNIVQNVQGARCRELQQACEKKGQLGERGEGNCKAYRAECGQRREVVNCRELRSACLNKERLGERGEGNCKQYRTQCRGNEQRSSRY